MAQVRLTIPVECPLDSAEGVVDVGDACMEETNHSMLLFFMYTNLLQLIDIFIFSGVTEATCWLVVQLVTETLLFAILHTGQDGGLTKLFTCDFRSSTIGQSLESALSTDL